MIISAQKGKQNKIHISIDGEYKLTVDADFWFSCGYISGDEIDEDQYQSLADRIAKRRCFNRALNILSRRDHCEKELYNKLRRADGDAAAQDAVFSQVPEDFAQKNDLVPLQTQCKDKDEYLTRPDLGRTFDEETREVIRRELPQKATVQLVMVSPSKAPYTWW